MNLVIGLGNPGEQYQKTRHNVGFMAVEFLVARAETHWTTHKNLQAMVAIVGSNIFVKPQTFMNDSGKAVSAILNYYKIVKKDGNYEDLITVIHDDSDQLVGNHKIVGESGTAGHHGLDSIVEHLKSKKFRRIKIGIRPAELSKEKIGHHIKAEEFVLKRFSKDEEKIIFQLIETLNIEKK